MNNQLNNDQDGKRPDNKDSQAGIKVKIISRFWSFLICLLVTRGVLRVVYQYAEG